MRTILTLLALYCCLPARAERVIVFSGEAPASVVAAAHANARARFLRALPQLGAEVVETAHPEAYAAAGVFAEADVPFDPAVMPSDPYYPSEWHLARIGVAIAWDLSRGEGEVVAILDTGVDGAHPDLAAKMLPGWNTYDDNTDTRDVYGHGTGVAGLAAAATDNGIGVAAPAWASALLPVRVSAASGTAYSSDIAAGFTWAADHGADVANLSYPAYTSYTVMQAARYAATANVVVVMAAGNSGAYLSAPEDPAVLVVGATDSLDNRATFSNYGGIIGLVAPGVSLLTTARGGGYWSPSGTSGSAPLVAGAAALVRSLRPDLGPADVFAVLEASALDLGTPGRDPSYGWGRIDAAAAAALAQAWEATTPPPPPPPPPPEPAPHPGHGHGKRPHK